MVEGVRDLDEPVGRVTVMAELSTLIVGNSGTLLRVGNAAQRGKAVVDFCEVEAGSVYSCCRWQVEPRATMLPYGLEEWRAPWGATVVGEGVLCAAESMLLQPQSNAGLVITDSFATAGARWSNGWYSPSPMETEEMLSALAGGVCLTNRSPVRIGRLFSRYFVPLTPVVERIDELILEEQGDEGVLLDRQEQVEWLKQALASYWRLDLPQPYMGFDLDEGVFVASWQSDDECNTLTIDAKERIGWFDPWPSVERGNPMPGEIDLDTEEAWERLRIALTTGRL